MHLDVYGCLEAMHACMLGGILYDRRSSCQAGLNKELRQQGVMEGDTVIIARGTVWQGSALAAR